jgi:hypothetical protein
MAALFRTNNEIVSHFEWKSSVHYRSRKAVSRIDYAGFYDCGDAQNMESSPTSAESTIARLFFCSLVA